MILLNNDKLFRIKGRMLSVVLTLHLHHPLGRNKGDWRLRWL